MVEYPQEVKEQAVIDLCSRKGSAEAVAQSYDTSCAVLYKWKNQLLTESRKTAMPETKNQKNEKNITVEELLDQLSVLKKEVAAQEQTRSELQREVYCLQLERDILEAADEVIKKDRALI